MSPCDPKGKTNKRSWCFAVIACFKMPFCHLIIASRSGGQAKSPEGKMKRSSPLNTIYVLVCHSWRGGVRKKAHLPAALAI
jgi:hypothetical protein